MCAGRLSGRYGEVTGGLLRDRLCIASDKSGTGTTFIEDVDDDRSDIVYDLGISSLGSLLCAVEFKVELGITSLLRALRKVPFVTGRVTSLLRERDTEVITGCFVTTVLRRLTVRSIGGTGSLRGCDTRSAVAVEGAVVSGNFIVEG